MKYIIFSDLHLGIHNAGDVWLTSSLKLADQILELCKEQSIENVLFLGDFFNDRRSLNLKCLDTAIEFANKFEEAKVHLWLVCGNHDTYLKNSLVPNSLRIFENYEFIHSITEVVEFDRFCTLIPWATSWKTAETPYLFGHFEINGFDIESGDNAFENNVSDFKRYTKVFSGHFHTPKTVRNVEYIGSVMPFSMHDVDSKRGFYLLEIIDEKHFKQEFIEFTESPKYKIIFSNQEIKEEDITGNVVKLIYVNELSSVQNEELMQKIAAMNPVQVNPDFKNMVSLEVTEGTEEPEEFNPSECKDSLALFYDYISKVTKPDYINEATIKAIVKQLLTQNEE